MSSSQCSSISGFRSMMGMRRRPGFIPFPRTAEPGRRAASAHRRWPTPAQRRGRAQSVRPRSRATCQAIDEVFELVSEWVFVTLEEHFMSFVQHRQIRVCTSPMKLHGLVRFVEGGYDHHLGPHDRETPTLLRPKPGIVDVELLPRLGSACGGAYHLRSPAGGWLVPTLLGEQVPVPRGRGSRRRRGPPSSSKLFSNRRTVPRLRRS